MLGATLELCRPGRQTFPSVDLGAGLREELPNHTPFHARGPSVTFYVLMYFGSRTILRH